MNPKLEALMRKKMTEKGKMHPVERDAKMHVLGDLHKMASDAMADKVKGIKKVSVMAPDEEGLQEGLDTAKDLVGSPDMQAHEGAMIPDMEELEEETGEDLDHDNEEGESGEHDEIMSERAHPNMPGGSSDMPPGEHDEDTHDNLDAQIEELMERKRRIDEMNKA